MIDTVRFADTVDGFAFEREAASPTAAQAPLWVTRDGGAKWRLSGLHGVVAFALSDRFAFALTGRCDSTGCTDVWLHRVGVATGHWKSLQLPFTSMAPNASMSVSGTSVWIAALPGTTPMGAARLWASPDRGGHFVGRSAPCQASAADVVAASASTLWAVCAGSAPTLRRTTDGGETWTPVVVPATLTKSATIAPTGVAGAVLAPGTGNRLLRTTDAGRTFRDVTPKGVQGRWVLVQFSLHVGGALLVTPDSAGGVRSDVQLWRSTDAGARWTGPVRVGS